MPRARPKMKPRGKPFTGKDDPRRMDQPWQRGQSGNPKGRPKEPITLAEVTKIAGQMTPDSLEVLNQAQHEAPWSTAIAAANSIIDRAVGKPKQSEEIEVKIEDDSMAVLTSLVAKHLGK